MGIILLLAFLGVASLLFFGILTTGHLVGAILGVIFFLAIVIWALVHEE